MPDFPGLNTQWIPHDLGRFGMPKLQRCDLVPDQLWPYDERIKSPEYDDDLPEDVVLHFFLRDAAFNSTWTYQDRCIESLKRFNGVIAPNFSLYADWPQAVQIWNCYRSHWLGAYWSQVHGIPVIPCVNWADPSSYEFCFAGLPVGGTFALATMEVDTDTETVLFLQGFVEFLRRCQPDLVCVYGQGFKDILETKAPVKRFPHRWDQVRELEGS